jgi:hypothetical protein
MQCLEILAHDIGRTSAEETKMRSLRRRQHALAASAKIGVVGIISATCMGGGVYGRLHDMGIAEKMVEKGWRDEKNNIMETEAESDVQQTEHSLKHPEKLIRVDEVRENISKKGDGNTEGQHFMVVNDMRAQVRNAFEDNHFTVLGFMASSLPLPS